MTKKSLRPPPWLPPHQQHRSDREILSCRHVQDLRTPLLHGWGTCRHCGANTDQWAEVAEDAGSTSSPQG